MPGERGLQGFIGPVGPEGSEGLDFWDSAVLVDLRETIVFIDSDFGVGSGVRISVNEILTAEHVVSGEVAVEASVKGEGLVFATITGYDSSRDVALLTFSNTSDGPFVTLPEDFSVLEGSEFRIIEDLGHEVAVLAYVSDISRTTPMITFGRIGVIWNVVPGDIRQGQIDAAVTAGMSGGGVFNNHGELLGIMLSISTEFEGISRYLSFREINEVIEDLRNGMKE